MLTNEFFLLVIIASLLLFILIIGVYLYSENKSVTTERKSKQPVRQPAQQPVQQPVLAKPKKQSRRVTWMELIQELEKHCGKMTTGKNCIAWANLYQQHLAQENLELLVEIPTTASQAATVQRKHLTQHSIA